MRMKFSYNLASSHVHLLKDLLKADKRLELDEYKAGGNIGSLKVQIDDIKRNNNGNIKFPFMYFYLDKDKYPEEIYIKNVFVVEKEEDLNLSEKQLYIRFLGIRKYMYRRIRQELFKLPFIKFLYYKKISKPFNS